VQDQSHRSQQPHSDSSNGGHKRDSSLGNREKGHDGGGRHKKK